MSPPSSTRASAIDVSTRSNLWLATAVKSRRNEPSEEQTSAFCLASSMACTRETLLAGGTTGTMGPADAAMKEETVAEVVVVDDAEGTGETKADSGSVVSVSATATELAPRSGESGMVDGGRTIPVTWARRSADMVRVKEATNELNC